MLFAVGFIPTFVMGGVTGVMLAVSACGLSNITIRISLSLTSTTSSSVVVVFGPLRRLFYWWPKIFGTQLNEKLGKMTFWTFFIGFHLTFFIQHFLGLLGMPRRVYTYLDGQGWDTVNLSARSARS